MATATQTTGVGSPISEINYQSGLPAIAQFLQTLIGQQVKETSSGTKGEAGTSTTSISGDRAALDALLQKFMNPDQAGLENLVQMLFQDAAAKVPELTTQFANATGTRVTNNSMLASSMAKMNTDLTRTIAQQVLQQQQQNMANATAVAGKIADTTKTQTTSDNKTTSTASTGEKTSAPNLSLKNNPIGTMAPFATMLGGWLLNKYGKTQSPGATAGADTAFDGNAVANQFENLGLATNAPMMDTGAALEMAAPAVAAPLALPAEVATAIPVSSPLSGFDLAETAIPAGELNFDVDFGGDLFSGMGDYGGFDIMDPNVDWFSEFGGVFADGGQAGRTRNKNYVGSTPDQAPATVSGTPSIRVIPSIVAPSVAAPAMTAAIDAPAAQASAAPRMVIPAAAELPAGSATASAGPSFSGLGDTPASSALANMGINFGVGQAVKAAGLSSGLGFNVGPIGFDPLSMGISFLVSSLINKRDETKTPTFGLQANGTNVNVTQDNYMQGFGPLWQELTSVLNSSLYDPAKLQTLAGPKAVGSTPQATAANLFKSVDSARVGNFDMNWFNDWSSRADAAVGRNTPAAPQQDISYGDGGIIKGKGGPTADRIPIRVSADEYVLPADVVRAITPEVLDDLVASLHMPAKGGTH